MLMQIQVIARKIAGNSQRHQKFLMTVELFAPLSILPQVGRG